MIVSKRRVCRLLVAFTRFGDSLGLAYQIADDVLDVTATSDQLGKTAGKDVAYAKSTYPLVMGIDEARRRAGALVNEACGALEAVGRLLPGVIGNADSLLEESYADGLLEAPVYTKPPVFRGLAVPEVLRSGDHARIARWRRDQSLLRTARRRPDLLAALPPKALSQRDREVLGPADPSAGPGVS